MYLLGLTAVPWKRPSRIVMCKCGPDEYPAFPDLAIISPCLIVCPYLTFQDEM